MHLLDFEFSGDVGIGVEEAVTVEAIGFELGFILNIY